MNKIIFWTGIYPGWTSRPIGAYQLAHHLRANKIECQVIDFCQWFDSDTLVSMTIPFISSNTGYIGISTTFWPSSAIPKNIKEAIRRIRVEYPSVKIIFGGPRANSDEVKLLADNIIVGDAEDKLLILLKGTNVGVIPFDITKLDHRFSKKDCIVEGEVLPIELGRGCIFKCKFCAHHNIGKPKSTYQRNMLLIEDEIAYNYENFKTTHYHFLDDTVNEDIDKVRGLSNLPARTGVDIKWAGYLRADLLWRYEDTPYLLKQSGMQSCFFGLETFHRNASISIGKGWSGNHAKEYIPHLYSNIWNKDIPIWNNFIVGLPGETESDLDSTVDWCINNNVGMNRFVPLSLYADRTDDGATSDFSRNYRKYGYSIKNGKWESEIMSEEDAHALSKKYNNMLRRNNTVACWTLFDLVNCEKSVDQIKSMGHIERIILKTSFRKLFLSKYIALLKSIMP